MNLSQESNENYPDENDRPEARDETQEETGSPSRSSSGEGYHSNPNYRSRSYGRDDDKIEADYQDRHRGDTIWTQGPRLFSDSRYDRSQQQQPEDNDNNNRPPRNNRYYRDQPRRPRREDDRYRRDSLEPQTGARGRRGEPITLAEELALERQGRNRQPEQKPENTNPPSEEKISLMAELEAMDMTTLIAEARKENMETIDDELRQDLIFRILCQRIRNSGLMFGEGTLEILPDEFGFLRSPSYNYLSCPDDIYISPSQIRRFGLRNGLTISGQIRPPKERERYFALLRVEAINHEDPNVLMTKTFFDDLTAMHPNERIVLENKNGDPSTRVVDMVVPIGFGQRGLIVSPPRAGKTILMQKIAKAVLANYPDSYVFMLLIDERPEEVTDMEREIKGTHCEVVSSTFDEPPSRHIQVSEMVLEKAKRMVEYGKNVVIFLDSITRLARAWNAECPDSGKTLSGGVDANALSRPKKFFGSARKIEEGGSLTIIATALIDTGSQMDEVIFEEFKGTGNLEIRLDRSLVDKRIWPAIDITQSGTRREEMILDPEEHHKMTILRRMLIEKNPSDAMDFLLHKISKTGSNAELLVGLKE